MRGFLARAGHLLGRLAVSLGYGGFAPAAQRQAPAVCFDTMPTAFEVETAAARNTWETQALAFSVATTTSSIAWEMTIPSFFVEMLSPLAGPETTPLVRSLETSPTVFAFDTEIEPC